MEAFDDDLLRFETEGAQSLPPTGRQAFVETCGARICFYEFGTTGSAVMLLHGGLGNSRNWGYQVTALLDAGFHTVLIDSRGHGRSTRSDQPFSYDLMANDAFAVMDAVGLKEAAFMGWSDGAATALVAAAKNPSRVSGVFFFACNVDPSGTLPFEITPKISRCLRRHRKDYAELSSTPEAFDQLMEALGPMQRGEPGFLATDLADIAVPVTVAQAEHDEFIRGEHAEYIAESIPDAHLVVLGGVSHFAPVQRPDLFNQAMLTFLKELPAECATSDHPRPAKTPPGT